MAIITSPLLWRRDQEVRYDYAGNVLRCWPMVLGAIEDITSPSVDIWRNGQTDASDALITAGSVTEDGTTHLLTYTLDASDETIWTLGQYYRAEFKYTFGGVVRIQHVMFSVVRTPLLELCPVDINDIKNGYSPAYAAMVQASLDSVAEEQFILPAWEDVLAYVESQGRRPSLLSSASVLRPMTLARVMTRVYEGLTRKEGDIWWAKAAQARLDYEEAKRNTTLIYDPSDAKDYALDSAWRQPQLLIGNPLTGVVR